MANNGPSKEFLSLEEVALLLDVTYQLIYRLVRAGDIPASRIGRVYRIQRSDLDAYLERSKTDAPQRVTCAACGRAYASRHSIKGHCETCEAPLCQDCVMRENRRFCKAHQP